LRDLAHMANRNITTPTSIRWIGIFNSRPKSLRENGTMFVLDLSHTIKRDPRMSLRNVERHQNRSLAGSAAVLSGWDRLR